MHDEAMMASSNENALLALCEGNPTVNGGFPSQKPVARSLIFFFDTPVIWDAIALIMISL